MKQALVNYMKNPKNDEIMTPEYAVKILLPYINPEWICWESCDCGNSNITKLLRENGNTVLVSHLKDNQNFFEYEPEEHYDIIITNPPYSIKDAWLKRAYELNKKFAFLLPITALEGKARSVLYRQYKELEVLIPDKRIEFYKGKNTTYFNSSWFCRSVLPEQLIFCELVK